MNRHLQQVYKFIKFDKKGYGEIYKNISSYSIANKIIYSLPFLSGINLYLYIKDRQDNLFGKLARFQFLTVTVIPMTIFILRLILFKYTIESVKIKQTQNLLKFTSIKFLGQQKTHIIKHNQILSCYPYKFFYHRIDTKEGKYFLISLDDNHYNQYRIMQPFLYRTLNGNPWLNTKRNQLNSFKKYIKVKCNYKQKMGLLYGQKLEPQNYFDTKKYQKILKYNACLQIVKFLSQYGKHEKKLSKIQKFGTEVEIFIIKKVDTKEGKRYSLITNDDEFLKSIKVDEIKDFEVQPEFARYMKEMVPKKPFDNFLNSYSIQSHFTQVYQRLTQQTKFQVIFGGSVLPFLGTENQYIKDDLKVIPIQEYKERNKYSQSETFLDDFITDHSRFKSFAMNTRLRRGEKPCIKIPVYQDINTLQKEMVFDHFGMGMGNCALQITFSIVDLDQARFLYDQLHVFSPFFLAVSATSSIIGKRIADIDSRFPLLAQSVDDRNERERKNIEKSKYSTINYYISNDKRNKKIYNDKKSTINKNFKKNLKFLLKKNNSEFAHDRRLLNHFSYQFIRDILVIFPDLVKKNNVEDTKDYDAINSCNWNNVRLKQPINYNEKQGWLIEFRAMDIPVTNKEKTATVFFALLLQRIIVDKKMGINMYVKMSKVDANFYKSIQKNAIKQQKITVRKYFCRALHGDDTLKDDTVEVTYKEFLLGNSEYSGMKQMIQKFIELNKDKILQDNFINKQPKKNKKSFIENQKNNDENSNIINSNQSIEDKTNKKQQLDIIKQIWNVFSFFVDRASGKLQTSAQYFRNFVKNHSKYKQDSVLSDGIVTDLIDLIVAIQTNDKCIHTIGNHLDFLNQ